MAVGKNTIDMTQGPLFFKILRFCVPLTLSFLLQLAFNAADMMVIGRWGSAESLAAIGATTSISNLLINAITGLSTGANMLAAQYFGARDTMRMTRLVHTTIALSLAGGAACSVTGLILLKWLVVVSDVPEAIQDKSVLYLAICFLGIPFQVLYNFGYAILRAVGNTKSPLYYLVFSGILNVLLNLFTVIVCKLDVAGVAIATVVSQALSAWLITRRLQKNHGSTRLYWKNLRLHAGPLKDILHLGIPAAVQSACFSLSNIVVQTGINSFGVAAVAGATGGYYIELLLYSIVFSMHHSAIAVIGQNYGAKKYKRVLKTIYILFAMAFVITLVCGWLLYFASPKLMCLFSTDPEVIRFGVLRAAVMFTIYFLLGFMDTSSGVLRGLGNSVYPAVASLAGTVGFRILWIKFAFPRIGTLESVMAVYPISWGLVAACNIIVMIILCRKLLLPHIRRSALTV